MKIIYLRPHTAYRTRLRSDTLFGLLMWGIHEIHGSDAVEELLLQFQRREPPFLLSSAMPFVETDDESRLFFPMPLIPLNRPLKPLQMDSYKSYKKLTWIPIEIFEELRSGKTSISEFFNGLEWSSEKELPIWKDKRLSRPELIVKTIMHNAIDRLSSSAGGDTGNLFPTEEYFIGNGGLYFLLNTFNHEILNLLGGVFQFYEHIGFGGDASTGKGFFDFTVEDFSRDFSIANANSVLNLSLYLPEKNELKAFRKSSDLLWYQMEMRKGKVGGRLFVLNDVWKKTVNAFREGSCFPRIDGQTIYGQFPVVKNSIIKPENTDETFDVHYNGYAFMIDYQQKRND